MKCRSRVLVLFIVLLLSVVGIMSACGSSSKGIEGKYTLVKMEVAGQEIDAALLEQMGFNDSYLTFTSKGEVSGKLGPRDLGKSEYKLEDNKITISGESMQYDMTLNDKELVMKISENTLTFTKS
jgi:hypothetical protein